MIKIIFSLLQFIDYNQLSKGDECNCRGYLQIAIEGCLHGQLDQVYHQLLQLQKNTGIVIDALIICGDFQATRDEIDLDYMHCPQKYKTMGSFQKYYNATKQTPFLTIFIGGNHQSVNYMRDLYFGGWVAPKIYYLGQAGSIYLKKGDQKIRISGLSGIYNDYDFKYCLKTQRIPLMGKSKITCYHIKQIQIFRMQLLSRIQIMKKQDKQKYGDNHHSFDIFLTHDWPKDIALYGNTQKLFQIKPFLKDQIQKSTLGCMPASRILKVAQPSYWFSAHMHVKYAAVFPHPENKFTHFLSLDKCLKNRSCLQVLKFQSNKKDKELQKKTQKVQLQLDRTWLSVLQLTIHLQTQNRSLYKCQANNQINLLDSKFMNSLITKYIETKENKFQDCSQFENNLIKWQGEQQKGTQIYQTRHFLQKILRVDSKIFKGIIFPYDNQQKQVNLNKNQEQQPHNEQKQNDQIQLDL